MRTTKPVSTISFNSPEFLELKLNELLKSGRISFWSFITHKPEDDEGGNKVHSHLYIEPAKMLQTDDLRAELKEFDPCKPDKPKGCISFNSSKFDHWYLYGLHDKRYLASKGLSRRFHYTHDEMHASDADDLLFKARSIDLVSLSPYADMEDAQRNGLTWAEYFSRGTVPLPQVALFERAWNMLLQVKTERNGRANHPMEVDYTTGEVLDVPTTEKNALELPKVKSDDALRIELINEVCKGFDTPQNPKELTSWHEVHPQGEYVALDPDESLPW